MLGEDGRVMDDGVSSRLAPDRFHMFTTTGGAANVMAWLEQWLQTEWPELKVYLTSTTDQWATMSVVGPKARDTVAKVCEDIELLPRQFQVPVFPGRNGGRGPGPRVPHQLQRRSSHSRSTCRRTTGCTYGSR